MKKLKTKIILFIMLNLDSMGLASSWTLSIVGMHYDMPHLFKLGNYLSIIFSCILIVICVFQYLFIKKSKKLNSDSKLPNNKL